LMQNGTKRLNDMRFTERAKKKRQKSVNDIRIGLSSENFTLVLQQ